LQLVVADRCQRLVDGGPLFLSAPGRVACQKAIGIAAVGAPEGWSAAGSDRCMARVPFAQ